MAIINGPKPAVTDVGQGTVSLMSLPAELHMLIARTLPYPDALSLKHTSTHFYQLVDSGIRLKVAWLIERRQLHLDFPAEGQCILKTDEAFCSAKVRRVMWRRRRHLDCGGLRGCMVPGKGACRVSGGVELLPRRQRLILDLSSFDRYWIWSIGMSILALLLAVILWRHRAAQTAGPDE